MLTWPAPKSLWLSELGPIVPADQVTSDLDYDVAIAGAGFTGLWTAYYLKKSDPSLRIGVFEAKFAGFGASGRNGGWASALFASSKSKVARLYGADAAKRLYRSLAESIDEIGKVVASEDIDADFHKGGTLFLARNQAQLERLGQELETERSFGFGEEDFRLLGAVEAKERIGASDVLGAGFTSNCARIHPAKLARGLRDVVVGLGVRVHEASVVTSIGPDGMEVNGCKVRAGAMIDALEGYRSSLPGGSRFTVPVYSLMIATEPLDDDLIEAVGLRDFETFADERHLIIYGQRSADNRIVFGGRGAPYHFASGKLWLLLVCRLANNLTTLDGGGPRPHLRVAPAFRACPERCEGPAPAELKLGATPKIRMPPGDVGRRATSGAYAMVCRESRLRYTRMRLFPLLALAMVCRESRLRYTC